MTETPVNPTPQKDDFGISDRLVRWTMFAPPLVGLLLLIVLLIVLVPRTPAQMSIISDVMTMAFILCPVVLCLLPLFFLFAVGAFYVGKLNRITGSKMGRLRSATRTAADTAAKYGDMASEKSIGFRTRVAMLNQLLQDDEDEDKTQ